MWEGPCLNWLDSFHELHNFASTEGEKEKNVINYGSKIRQQLLGWAISEVEVKLLSASWHFSLSPIPSQIWDTFLTLVLESRNTLGVRFRRKNTFSDAFYQCSYFESTCFKFITLMTHVSDVSEIKCATGPDWQNGRLAGAWTKDAQPVLMSVRSLYHWIVWILVSVIELESCWLECITFISSNSGNCAH